ANVFGESAVGINADDFHELANVGFAGAALKALAAGHVHFRRNKVAFLYRGDFVADRGNVPAKFMARNERRMNALLRPGVPIVNVYVGPANRGDLYLHQDIGWPECGYFYITNLGARFGFGLYDRQHGVSH